MGALWGLVCLHAKPVANTKLPPLFANGERLRLPEPPRTCALRRYQALTDSASRGYSWSTRRVMRDRKVRNMLNSVLVQYRQPAFHERTGQIDRKMEHPPTNTDGIHGQRISSVAPVTNGDKTQCIHATWLTTPKCGKRNAGTSVAEAPSFQTRPMDLALPPM